MFRLFKYISLKKTYNIIYVYISYWISSIFKKVIIWAYPFSLTTETTNQCNLLCLECPTGNNSTSVPKGIMNFSTYKKVIDETKNYLIYQMLYLQGEPFLNADLFKMIKYSDDNKIYTSLSTNGHFLSPQDIQKIIQSELKRIIISLDGATQESYEKYRVGGDLQKVISGIDDLIKTKKQLKSIYPKVIIQFLVFSHNEHEISEIKKLCKKLNVDKLEIKTAQILNPNNYKLIPDTNKFSRYLKQNNSYRIKNKLKNRCFRIWSTLVIRWNGATVPCCFDKNNHNEIGNIVNQNTLLLWKSNKFNKFRNTILINRKNVDMCCNCTEGLTL